MVIVVEPVPVTNPLEATLKVSIAVPSALYKTILPDSTSTASLKVRVMLLLALKLVEPSDGDDEDKVGALSSTSVTVIVTDWVSVLPAVSVAVAVKL